MSDELRIVPWPSTPEEHRWHRFLEAARKKWGYELVPAARIYEAFDRRVAADFPAFKSLAPGRHFLTLDADISHLIRLRPLKGAMHVVTFGVLLSFMPVASGKTLRRAQVSARAHPALWDEPSPGQSNSDAGNLLRRMADPLSDTDLIGGVHNLNGMGFVEYTLDHHWRKSLPQMRAWFGTNTTLESLLHTARMQLEEDDVYLTHYPSQRLVAACLLARLGRADEARLQLERWKGSDPTALAHPKWQESLERIIADASG